MMYRKPVNKRRSARSFRKNVRRTKSANMQKAPQRGGWRL
jgi:hypothetical protein